MAMKEEMTSGMVVGLTKTLYYRETDSKTGKQTWIKLRGVSGTNHMVFVRREDWTGLSQDSTFIVYKTSRRTSK